MYVKLLHTQGRVEFPLTAGESPRWSRKFQVPLAVCLSTCEIQTNGQFSHIGFPSCTDETTRIHPTSREPAHVVALPHASRFVFFEEMIRLTRVANLVTRSLWKSHKWLSKISQVCVGIMLRLALEFGVGLYPEWSRGFHSRQLAVPIDEGTVLVADVSMW